MIIGGLLGFMIGLSFGLAQGSGWPSIVWRSSVAACLSGIALRWWGSVWVKSLQAAHRERQAELQKSNATAALPKFRL
jgi:hypothetical protein